MDEKDNNSKSEDAQLRELFANKPENAKARRKSNTTRQKKKAAALTDEQVKELAETICTYQDEEIPKALILLVDEITRDGANQFAYYIIRQVAFGRCDEAMDRETELFRKELAAA